MESDAAGVEPEMRAPTGLTGVKSTDRVEPPPTPARSRRRDRRSYSPITSSSDEVPQKVRIEFRRLQRQFGHVPHRVLLNLLRSARVSRSTLMQSCTSDALSVKKLHHDVLVIRRRCPIGMSSIMPWVKITFET